MTQQSQRKSVLVIDDEPQVLGAIADTLEDEFEVMIAASPLTGIRLLEKHRDLSVVISDQRMPEMSGDEFLAKAREISPATRLMITGFADLEAVIRAVNLGQIFGYISKPWNPDHLKLAVLKAAEHCELLKKLETEQRLLHNLMDNIPDAIFFKDLEHRYVRVNKVQAARYKITRPEDMIGKADRDFMPADRALAREAEDAEIIRTGAAMADRIGQADKDAKKFHWYSTTKAPVKDGSGRVVSLVGITRDITERKRIEAEQARLVAIIEATPDMVATVAPNLRILYCNDAGRRLMGIGADADVSNIRVHESHPEWARKLVMEQGIPTALSAGSWSGETALLRRDGREIPVLQVIIAHKGPDGEVGYLSTIIRDITQRKEAEAKVARLNRIYSVLSGINTTIVRVHERDELFAQACRIAVEHGKFVMAWIGVLDAATREVRLVAKAGRDDGYLDRIKLTVDEEAQRNCKLVARALSSREPVVCNDIAADERMSEWRMEALKRGYRAVAVFPLIFEERAAGVFVLYAPEPGFFDEQEMKLLVEMAGDISFALEHIAKEKKLDYLAYYDALTGLPNRTLIHDRLAHAIQGAKQNAGKVAVLLCDIKRFHHINDTLGRHAGDAMLREFAQRLGRLWPEPDHVARISADCFAGVLSGIKEASEVAHLLEKPFTEALSSPFAAGGKELMISMTAGVALFPTDGEDADTLLKNAEAALKKAKAGGEKYLFYRPKMNAAVAETLALENKMRRAIEQEQFTLHYQPKVDLAKGHISGLEGLIRWNDPETGLVPPGKFIPLLEETGLILDVGAWAIRKAILDRREWTAKGLGPPRIAVNVSAIQLRQKDFVGIVKRAIEDSGQEPGGLDLEITESLIMENIEDNIIKLAAIREMGIGVVIDDFGTGYSSLSYIAKLPINALKIDRAFIMNVASSSDSMAIVSTIISLAHSLSLEVVAEGVETREQRNLLRLLKCDSMQGFLFSKSLPAEKVVAKLKSGEWKT